MFTQLEGFLATVREKSISRAAEKSFLSQPALTARLQSLEQELGAPLLIRTSRGVRLSEAGKAFLPYAQRAIQAIDEGRKLVSQLTSGDAGVLTIATVPGLLTAVLPPMLKRFRDAFPNVPVNVRTAHPDEIVDLVLREEVQLGFACDVEHPDLESIRIHEDEIVCVHVPSHPVSDGDVVSLREIASAQLIMFSESDFEQLLSNLLHEAGIPPAAVLTLDSIDAAKKMVESGLGVAFLPRIALEQEEIDSGRFVIRRLPDADAVRRVIVALHRRDAHPLIGPPGHFLDVVLEKQP
ncbi:LysR family transcriptional regulator [Arthrobacter sp. M4]|uniref:LysR family transcriptional regulator n=1 Tax=Arthrobacter sp. M4 TaxID=218160 RepID=UPI001CDD03FC|nr:LysR family transcriptional regulator [Arthrobacter sp. M4]MCA4132511.1 LysR family transcriptional regulator [Arthrobacter sp. M4]